jgi:hypothetical protein
MPGAHLFRTQKIEVSVTTGPRVREDGKVSGKIVAIPSVVDTEREGNPIGYLRRSVQFAFPPRLSVNRHRASRGDSIEERLLIWREDRRKCINTWHYPNAGGATGFVGGEILGGEVTGGATGIPVAAPGGFVGGTFGAVKGVFIHWNFYK